VANIILGGYLSFNATIEIINKLYAHAHDENGNEVDNTLKLS